MKILNIYFKNINSLKGENRVHFDRTPIADGGVFAITGDNGSGKSSILDVITLALYGETFRFDRPANHVMTKSTAESFAELEFSLGANIFKSSWHVKRKNDKASNELLPAEMELLQLNGEQKIIESSIQKVREKISELTGMDFHKFSKSIVLSQGDFAAFLNALDSERMDILEKICKTDIYTNYKKTAEEKYDLAHTQLQHLEQDLSAIPIMDAKTIEAKELDLQDFQEQLVSLENEQNTTLEQLNWIQNVTVLQDQEKTLSDKLIQETKLYKENQQSLEIISNARDITLLKDDISIIDSVTKELQLNKKTLDSYHIELELLQKQLNSSDFDKNSQTPVKTPTQQKESITQSTQKLGELKSQSQSEKTLLDSLNQQLEEKESILLSTENWLKEHENDKILVNNFPEIEASNRLKRELSEIAEKQKTFSKWSKKTTDASKSNKSKITAQNNTNNELKKLIKEKQKSLQKIAGGRSLEDLHDLRSEQQDRIRDFQELYELAAVNSKLGKKNVIGHFFGSLSRNSTEKDEYQIQKEADQLQLKIGKENNIVKALELAVTNEALLIKMEADRAFLIDGKSCPLCGALNHPFAKHPPVASNSQIAFSDQQKKVKELIAKSNSLKKQITFAQKEKEKNDLKDTQLQKIRSQWVSLANKLNVANKDIEISNLSSIKELLKNEKQELSNITQLLKQFSKQQSVIKKTELSIESNEVTLNRLIQETETLDSKFENRPQESIELERTHAKCLEQDKVLSEKVDKQLEQLGEKIPSKKNLASFIEQLKNRKQEFQKNEIRQKALSGDIKDLKSKIPSCSIKLKDIDQDITQYSEQVQQEEIAGLHLSLIEKQKLIAEKEPVLAKQESELKALSQTLLDKYKNTEQKNFLQLKETMALAQRQPEIEEQGINIKQNIDQLNNDLKQISSQLKTEKSTLATASSDTELLMLQKSIKEKIDITKHEINTLQTKLSKQGESYEKRKAILTKLADQKSVVKSCEEDKKLTTDENAIQFRKKVQHTMADKLLSHTNQILEKISGRYYVRKGKSEQGLALEIEDTKQHNVHRLPKTLSGGESFVISLSLALGLAEMANNGQAIDSFFLDEGFGNLDAESLYLVMTTLENLKTKGKIVGVISHVEGVRKRIKTQIKMTKEANGFSHLKVIS